MPRTWTQLPGGQLKRHTDSPHTDPHRWRERRVYTRTLRRRASRRLRQTVPELLRQERWSDLSTRVSLHASEWML